MHARRTQRGLPELDASTKCSSPKPRSFRFQLDYKARLIFLYAFALAGMLLMLVIIAAPMFETGGASDKALLDVGFSHNFLKAASTNLSSWRENLFTNTIALQSATERRAMKRVQPQGHSRFNLFNPIVQCPKGEPLQLFGGAEGADGAKYLCPSLLTDYKSTCVIYSLGSNLDYTFELDILQRTSCQVVTFDCTVNGASVHPRHTFLKKCLGSTVKMNADPDAWITLPAAMMQLGHSAITLLKIDIEGYEFDVLGAYTKSKESTHALPAMIAMEMHYDDLYFGTNAWLNSKENGTLYWPGHGEASLVELSLFMFHLGNLGYAVVSRDDNPVCGHCSELTLLRVE
jgi:Methyltransferase domain